MPTLPELKLRYYELMIRYYSHYNNYLEITRCYRSVYEVESVQEDPAKWAAVSVDRWITVEGSDLRAHIPNVQDGRSMTGKGI